MSWLVARHLRHDGPRSLAVTYVRPTGDEGRDARALRAIAAADADTVVTGYPYLEVALRESLAQGGAAQQQNYAAFAPQSGELEQLRQKISTLENDKQIQQTLLSQSRHETQQLSIILKNQKEVRTRRGRSPGVY